MVTLDEAKGDIAAARQQVIVQRQQNETALEGTKTEEFLRKTSGIRGVQARQEYLKDIGRVQEELGKREAEIEQYQKEVEKADIDYKRQVAEQKAAQAEYDAALAEQQAYEKAYKEWERKIPYGLKRGTPEYKYLKELWETRGNVDTYEKNLRAKEARLAELNAGMYKDLAPEQLQKISEYKGKLPEEVINVVNPQIAAYNSLIVKQEEKQVSAPVLSSMNLEPVTPKPLYGSKIVLPYQTRGTATEFITVQKPEYTSVTEVIADFPATVEKEVTKIAKKVFPDKPIQIEKIPESKQLLPYQTRGTSFLNTKTNEFVSPPPVTIQERTMQITPITNILTSLSGKVAGTSLYFVPVLGGTIMTAQGVRGVKEISTGIKTKDVREIGKGVLDVVPIAIYGGIKGYQTYKRVTTPYTEFIPVKTSEPVTTGTGEIVVKGNKAIIKNLVTKSESGITYMKRTTTPLREYFGMKPLFWGNPIEVTDYVGITRGASTTSDIISTSVVQTFQKAKGSGRKLVKISEARGSTIELTKENIKDLTKPQKFVTAELLTRDKGKLVAKVVNEKPRIFFSESVGERGISINEQPVVKLERVVLGKNKVGDFIIKKQPTDIAKIIKLDGRISAAAEVQKIKTLPSGKEVFSVIEKVKTSQSLSPRATGKLGNVKLLLKVEQLPEDTKIVSIARPEVPKTLTAVIPGEKAVSEVSKVIKPISTKAPEVKGIVVNIPKGSTTEQLLASISSKIKPLPVREAKVITTTIEETTKSVGLIPSTVAASASLLKPREEQKEKTSEVLSTTPQSEIGLLQNELNLQAESSSFSFREASALKQASLQQSSLREAQLQKLRQAQISSLSNINISETRTRTPIPEEPTPRVKVPWFTYGTEPKPKSSSLYDKIQKVYNVVIWNRGKEQVIARGLTKGRALKVGVKEVLSSLRASFKLKPTGQTYQEDIPYEVPQRLFGRSKYDPERYVQLKTTRFGTGGETKQAQFFRKQKKGKIKWF